MASLLSSRLPHQRPSNKPVLPPSSSGSILLHNFTYKTRFDQSRFKCSAGGTGFFTKLGRLLKEKAKSDVEKLFSGFSKTRDNLAVIDELLLYWNLSDTDRVLDELEEVNFWKIKVSLLSYYRKC